jgi:large conductance mechanosensitive channel
MGFWKDFKAFAVKGNVIDLAVGVIIGAAFGKIVTALVADLIMPLISILTGSAGKFDDKFIVLKAVKEGDIYPSLEKAREAGANVFAYGHFIQTIVDFLIIAFFIFIAIRFISRFKEKEEKKAAPAGPSSTDKLLMEIRDELKKPK